MPKLSLISNFGSLCTIAWDYKSTVKYTVINCGDFCFSLWVDIDIANGSDSAYLAFEILCHVIAYLKSWHVHSQKHVTNSGVNFAHCMLKDELISNQPVCISVGSLIASPLGRSCKQWIPQVLERPEERLNLVKESCLHLVWPQLKTLLLVLEYLVLFSLKVFSS